MDDEKAHMEGRDARMYLRTYTILWVGPWQGRQAGATLLLVAMLRDAYLSFELHMGKLGAGHSAWLLHARK
jgi:hypothetical protein